MVKHDDDDDDVSKKNEEGTGYYWRWVDASIQRLGDNNKKEK